MHPTPRACREYTPRDSQPEFFPRPSDLRQMPESERHVSHHFALAGLSQRLPLSPTVPGHSSLSVLTYFLPFGGKTETNACLASALAFRNVDSPAPVSFPRSIITLLYPLQACLEQNPEWRLLSLCYSCVFRGGVAHTSRGWGQSLPTPPFPTVAPAVKWHALE